MSESVIVWDSPNEAPNGSVEVLRWRGYGEIAGGESVPLYLENNADRLRAKYLAFIHDLGECQVAGRRVVEHLDLGDGFSYWWMTQIAEKSPFKSPRIYDCLRLMALEEMLLQRAPSDLTLNSEDRSLALAIGRLCTGLRINFLWLRDVSGKKDFSLRAVYSQLPMALKGLISLRHLIPRWKARKLRSPGWFSGDDSIFICSYFFNLNQSSCSEGRFHSNQWGALSKYITENGKHANWLHHLLFTPEIPDAQTAIAWLRLFNQEERVKERHSFLESYISWEIIFRALRNWCRLNAAFRRLRDISDHFKPESSNAWLWPFLQTDWEASLRGPVAMNNCLWVELFDKVLKDIPHQKIGLYLWENQGWESALLRAWRRNGHGDIIGVPHATVVFWHLNNFEDCRCQTSIQFCAKPYPDHLAINGPMAWKAFLRAGMPARRFLEVEALRFQYLNEVNACQPKNSFESTARVRKMNILILGDFTFKQTLEMLECVWGASHLIDFELSIALKPHPACGIRNEDFPRMSFELTRKSLSEILPLYDLAFASNTTSAGLDAYLANMPVVVYLAGNDFNHSPLRGVEGVSFVGSAEGLADILLSGKLSVASPDKENFFWLDSTLPKWGNLLAITDSNGQ